MAASKMTNIEVRKKNRNRIYRYMRKAGTVSNPDISYELKLSLPTVTQNTKELLEMGLIAEKGELESTGGRKAKALSINANSKLAVGLDITRNHIGLLLTNLTGEILKYDRQQIAFSEESAYFSAVNKKLELFLQDTPANTETLLGIGISFPGIVDLDQKKITNSHVLDVQALAFSEVEQFFSFPCFFLNDANAGAYGEGIQAEDVQRFFYLSLSNTVGGAVYDHENLIYGSEFRCGEVGHMTIVPDGRMCYCGKCGCLDPYCTAKRLADLTDGKLEAFFDGLKQRKRELVEIWEAYTDDLALAVNNLHMILDCDIVLGGYVGSYAGEWISEIQRKVALRNTFAEDGTFVKACRYRVGAAALGAALYVIEKFVEQV